MSGTQVARHIVPILAGFSIRGLEQLTIGSLLVVVSALTIVSPVATVSPSKVNKKQRTGLMIYLSKLAMYLEMRREAGTEKNCVFILVQIGHVLKKEKMAWLQGSRIINGKEDGSTVELHS
ncbi:hypothetical protein AHAS_Ahas03G0197900 [Arachis hypogaea]